MRAFFALLIFIAFDTQAAPTPDTSKPKAIIQEIALANDVKRYLYPAIVEAKVCSTVTADLDGRVKRVVKTLGAKVKAGEVVLYLENQDPAFTYAAVPVRAPVSGILSQVNFQLMSQVTKGEKLFTVLDPGSLKISAEIPSSEIHVLSTGTAGVFKWSPLSDQTIPVRMVGISPMVDPRTGTASAEMEFVKTKSVSTRVDGKIVAAAPTVALPPAGAVGQVVFEVLSGQVITLAENSLSYVDGKPTVRVIDESNKSHRRPIELGEQRDDRFVVKSGLAVGDRVIVRASRSPKDNEEVEVEDPKKQDKK